MGWHFLLQGIFLTQELNPGLLHCRQMIYQLSFEGSPESVVLSNHLILCCSLLLLPSIFPSMVAAFHEWASPAVPGRDLLWSCFANHIMALFFRVANPPGFKGKEHISHFSGQRVNIYCKKTMREGSCCSNFWNMPSEYSLQGLMLKLKLLIHWPPDTKSWLIRKDPNARKDGRQKEKRAAEDEVVR